MEFLLFVIMNCFFLDNPFYTIGKPNPVQVFYLKTLFAFQGTQVSGYCIHLSIYWCFLGSYFIKNLLKRKNTCRFISMNTTKKNHCGSSFFALDMVNDSFNFYGFIKRCAMNYWHIFINQLY